MLESGFRYFIFYKPYGILAQFTDEGNRRGIASVANFPPHVYPVGRLEADSEGLLLLTDDKRLNKQVLDPTIGHWRTYLIQVEGDITPQAVQLLEIPMEINLKTKLYRTLPSKCERLFEEPELPERNPPVRFRKSQPTSWIRLELREGKNQQVRKMAAQVGFPALRLVREGMAGMSLDGLQPGEFREIDGSQVFEMLRMSPKRR
jgi:23S rRNA pseudouridine2457 synthase